MLVEGQCRGRCNIGFDFGQVEGEVALETGVSLRSNGLHLVNRLETKTIGANDSHQPIRT